MARGVRKQEGEDLSDSNVERVVKALAQDSPITKKAACEMLAIAYNPARLTKIIQEHEETKAFRATMRKKIRGTPIDNDAASTIVSGYLSGESLSDISDRTYRSTQVIKTILHKYNVPVRNSSVDYFHPTFIDNDEAIRDDYVKGDLVYSARYDQPATIDSVLDSKIHGKVYGIWLHGDNRKHAYQPYYELADLRRIKSELEIVMKDLDKEEVRHLINEGLRNAKKQEDSRK